MPAAPQASRPLGARPCAGLVIGVLLLAPACAAAATGSPHLARSADGVPIAYEARGSGATTLLFVHGWCCDRTFWRGTLDALASEWRVAALDLAGHGDSGHERERWTLEALADDVVAVADALGAERLILVGHSMGGPVALLAAAKLGPRALGVIGVDTLHDAEFRYPPGFLEEVAASLESDFGTALEASMRSALPEETDPRLRSWILARARRTDRASAIALVRGLEGFDLPAALSETGVPVRTVNAAPHGPDAPVTERERNRRYADFDAVELEDCGHFPMLERPAEFQAALVRYLRELDPR